MMRSRRTWNVIKAIHRLIPKISGYRIRTALFILIAVYMLMLASALTFMTYREYRASMTSITDHAKVIRIFSIAETDKFINSTKEFLTKLALHSAVRTVDSNRCDPLLAEFQKLQPLSSHLVIYDKTGKLLCSALETNYVTSEISKSPEFFEQVLRTRLFTIGMPEKNSVSGKWVTTFAHPILDEFGQFRGVAGLVIELQRLQPFASKLNSPPGTFSGIVNRAGTIVAASENPETMIGRTIVKEAFEKSATISDGTFRMKDYKGSDRFVSLGTIQGSDWKLFVSLDVKTLLDPIFNNTLRRLFFLLLMFLALFYVTLRVTRLIVTPIEAVSNTLGRVTAGDLHARVIPAGPVEIFQIASKLNAMLDTRESATQQLRQSEERFKTAFRTSPDALSITRLDDHRFLEVNDGFISKSGWSRDEIVGKTADELNLWKWPHDRQKLVRAIQNHGECRDMESEFVSKDGRIWVGVISAQLIVLEGAPCILSSTRDLTERNMSLELIHNLSFFDPLTGLTNRRLFIDRLQQSITASLINKKRGAVVLVNIDSFKTINDSLGHDDGDLLLKEVAKRLQGCLKAGDTLARFGGDEFVILMNDMGDEQESLESNTLQACQNIHLALSQPYYLSCSEHHRSASIGITFIGAENENAREPLRRVDLAMDSAKKSGRNTLRIFNPEMQLTLNARSSMEEKLLMAIKTNQLSMLYQVQVTDKGHIVGAEALVRWNDPQRAGAPISPSEFTPLAEETGLILPLGQWVLETACHQIAEWDKNPALSHLIVAVNVSARQFYQIDFVDQVRSTLKRTGAKPERLKLELTESTLISNIADLRSKMEKLKALGISFALDDFGTGYSALAFLKQLPLDQLKIDRSFVRNILIDPNDKAIAQMIIALANSMKLGVIAEGVETSEQRQVLLEIGCNHFQGFLFSSPVSVDEFMALFGGQRGIQYFHRISGGENLA